MIRFAYTFLLSLLFVGCQTAVHSPQSDVIVQTSPTPSQKFWLRTAKLIQPLMPDTGKKRAESESRFATHRAASNFLPVNQTAHSLYKAGSIFPSPSLSSQPQTNQDSIAKTESPSPTPSVSLPSDEGEEETALASGNPLHIQSGDTEAFKRLLREIAVVPSEERKVDDPKLSELLTSFRKETMGTDIENEYLALLRKRVLPEMEPIESTAPLPQTELASAKRSAKKPVSKQEFEYEEEYLGEELAAPPLVKKNLPRKDVKEDKPIVAQNPLSATAPVYPSLTQLPSAAPATIQTSYAQNHAAGVPNSAITSYGAGDWQAPTRQAIEQLRYAIEQTPNGRTVSNEMRLRMLEMLLGNKAEAAKAMPSADKTMNEFMGHQVLGFSALLDDSTAENRGRYISAAYRFNEGLSELQKLCPIKLKNVTFVKDWFGFGQYIPHAGDFHPGEEFNVYFEMDNPKARATDGFEVNLAVSYEIRDAHATVIVKQDAGKPGDRALSRKRDYCLTIPGTLPTSIKPGQYQLRISVTDLNDDSMQYAEEQIPFKVAPSLTDE